MDAHIRTLLQEIAQEGVQNDARVQDRRQKMLNLEQETAQLLNILIRSGRKKSLLEIGTSNGYSTIWLAMAAQETGGHVISIDREREKHALASANLQRAGLHALVDLKCGDATQVVASLPGPFDCIFFDADRHSAPDQLALLVPKLAPDALILADNALSHPAEIANYLAAINALPNCEHMIISVGKGLSLAYVYRAQ